MKAFTRRKFFLSAFLLKLVILNPTHAFVKNFDDFAMYSCRYFSFNTKIFYSILFLLHSIFMLECWDSNLLQTKFFMANSLLKFFGQIEWALRMILSLEQTSWTRSVTTTKFTEQNYGARKVRRLSSFVQDTADWLLATKKLLHVVSLHLDVRVILTSWIRGIRKLFMRYAFVWDHRGLWIIFKQDIFRFYFDRYRLCI